jgi:hypothetical protein
MPGVDEVTWEGGCLGVATAPKTTTMSDRKLRPREKKMHYAPPRISEDERELQPGPSTSAGSSKGKQRAKKRRITKSHSPTPAGRRSDAGIPPQGPGVPTFEPMIPKTRPHSAFNKLPAAIRRLSDISPEAIFKLFLTPSLLETIATHTNDMRQKSVRNYRQEDPGKTSQRKRWEFGWEL